MMIKPMWFFKILLTPLYNDPNIVDFFPITELNFHKLKTVNEWVYDSHLLKFPLE